jgi:hypothetical protein
MIHHHAGKQKVKSAQRSNRREAIVAARRAFCRPWNFLFLFLSKEKG